MGITQSKIKKIKTEIIDLNDKISKEEKDKNNADIFYKKKSDLATKISELNSEVLNKTTIFNDLKKSKH